MAHGASWGGQRQAGGDHAGVPPLLTLDLGRPGHPKRDRLMAPDAPRAEPEWLDRRSAMGRYGPRARRSRGGRETVTRFYAVT